MQRARRLRLRNLFRRRVYVSPGAERGTRTPYLATDTVAEAAFLPAYPPGP